MYQQNKQSRQNRYGRGKRNKYAGKDAGKDFGRDTGKDETVNQPQGNQNYRTVRNKNIRFKNSKPGSNIVVNDDTQGSNWAERVKQKSTDIFNPLDGSNSSQGGQETHMSSESDDKLGSLGSLDLSSSDSPSSVDSPSSPSSADSPNPSESVDSQDPSNISSIDDIDVNEGAHIKLPYTYILWSHDITNKHWDIQSYKKLCKIDNVADFWKVFNNFKVLGMKFMHFFLMKEGTEPLWEHQNNRNGGVCSFKIELDGADDVWQSLCCRMVCNLLNNQPDDINGVSISPKNSWAIIKIWNRDSKNDLSITLADDIIKKYESLSIKYREHTPEY